MDSEEYRKRYRRLTVCRKLVLVPPVCCFLLCRLLVKGLASADYFGNPSIKWITGAYSGMFTAVLVLYTFILYAGSVNRKLRELMGSAVRSVLEESFALEQYLPNSHIPGKLARASRLFLRDYGFLLSDLSGSQLIVGRYRGVRFRFSNLRLSHGRGGRRDVLFCALEHQGAVNGRITAKENKVPWQESVENQSDEFDQRFDVKANDQEGAARILTPAFTRRIVRLDRSIQTSPGNRTFANPKMDLRIDEGCVYAALWNKPFLFDTGSEDPGEVRKAAREDVRRLTAVLDTFMDSPALFPGLAPADACREDARSDDEGDRP